MPDKYATTHYHSYLQLDKVINAQHPKSAESDTPAHDEMLFIIIHQAYELWFKQIIHELTSTVNIMQQPFVAERLLHTVAHRLNRVVEVQQLLIQQIRVLETLSPLEFLNFRDYLFPASGFQSFQFRVIETLLGLRPEERLLYNDQPFYLSLQPNQQVQLQQIMALPSLFTAVESWLVRMPFTNVHEFNFLSTYQAAVQKMYDKEQAQINSSDYLTTSEKEQRLSILQKQQAYFTVVNNADNFKVIQAQTNGRLSYEATLNALFIHLYQHEPMLSTPYKILMQLVDIDELFTTWRYRHAQMVMRMLGRKMGTGGSSGHDYLKDTAAKHQVFADFHNLSTLLVPSNFIPPLPPQVSKLLNYHFSHT